MREIKFRAWWKHINTMQYFDTLAFLNFDDDVLMYQDIPEEVPHGIGRIDNTQILMQYTGLKDKKGVEIYEGDIVSFKVFDGLTHVNGTTSVYFSEGAFRLNEHHPIVDYIKNGELEVIGNIYEHPELLEEDFQ